MTNSALELTDSPYSPSWIDRLIHWIEGLPGPSWLYYLVGLIVSLVIVNGVFWLDGSLAVGTFHSLPSSYAPWIVYWPALYHYLTRVASRALHAYRPLLESSAGELGRIEYQLTVLPRGVGAWLIPIASLSATAFVLGSVDSYGELAPRTALHIVADIPFTSAMSASFLALAVRSVRQLLQVSRLHWQARNIDLLHLKPAYAFSQLTARTGIGLVFILLIAYTQESFALGSQVLDTVSLVANILVVILAVAIFLLPIMSMQDRLEEEKDRQMRENSLVLEAARHRIHNQVHENDYQDTKGSLDAIAALIQERQLLEKVSTWPWDPRTLRGFSSALLLPIFLWLVIRLLERFLQ